MSETPLTPRQQQVLTLLATGTSATEAAASAGIHRNTIANWRRTLPVFRETAKEMALERAQFWREYLPALASLALSNLEQTRSNPAASTATRRRAERAIAGLIATPHPLA